MASMIRLIIAASFFMVICMHSSNARLLPSIVKPSSTKLHHLSISLKITQKDGAGTLIEGAQAHARTPTTPFSKGASKNLSTGNAHNKKIVRVAKEGSEMVESSPSHHVALLKGKHVKDPEKPSLSQDHGKEEFTDLKNDDIVVMDYQPPHRKTPIHNK
ncbi:hypothetical protein CTI12_AA142670 [Artemisia annua]|uniref:Uncharacterized protein n=1 Tax=Artemisia annua TaxID=35608 RepID=A0A2U1PK75_ARTAN|nr:hypothetical protein CTI12_AA142670 [Artemisia annua]